MSPVNEAGEQVEEKQQQQPEDDTVTLSATQYQAVLDRIEELEALRQLPTRERDEDDVESLAQEARGPQQQQQQFQGPYKSLEDMSNQELVSFVMQNVQESQKATLTEIQTLKVLREIDKCESKYNDFWDYEKEVYKIATSNPTLTMEQAYKLAKSEKSKGAEKSEKDESVKEEGKRTVTEKLFSLPPRPIPGEKPTVAVGATKQGGLVSLKDAAAAAWEEVSKGMKS